MANKIISAFHFSYPFVLHGAWAWGSIYYLSTANSDMFQRLGAYGVAVFILLYGMLLMRSSRSAHQVNSLFQRISTQLHRETTQRVSTLYRILEIESATIWKFSFLLTEKKSVDLSKEELQDLQGSFDSLSKMVSDFSEMEKESQEESDGIIRELSILADEVSEVSSKVNIAQICFLILATMQWGFGDMFVTFVRQ